MTKLTYKSILFILLFIASFGAAKAQCIDNGNYWNESWVSCQISQNPNPIRANSHWILYEFHEFQYIDESYIWNANRVGESGWGAKMVAIDYSLDGTNWIELGQYNFPQAPESDLYTGFEGPSFGGQFINKILITILTTHTETGCASIAEVQFKIDPTACYGQFDNCGLCNGPGEITWYFDADGDGLGNASISQTNCTQPTGYVSNDSDLCDNGILGWNDVEPLFLNNGCTGCHGSSGGLDLTTFAGISSGGNKCESDLLTGNNLVGIITTTNFNGCGTPISGPSMNDRSGGAFDPTELALLQAWVDSGALENCSDYCQNNQTISVTYFTGNTDYQQVSNQITANNLIQTGAIIIYDAGVQICLDSGFEVQLGAEFLGIIEGCVVPQN